MSASKQLQSLIRSIETDLGIEPNAFIHETNQSIKIKDRKKKITITKSMNQPEITKLDIRVGQITKVWKHETAEKLFCEEINVGEERPRVIASGLVAHYSLEEMQNRRVLVLCNLKPRNLVGFRSHGMVLCAVVQLENENEKVVLVTPPEGAVIGERITFDGLQGEPISPAQVEKKKVLLVLGEEMKTDDKGIAKWKEHEFQTSKGPCTASVTNGVIR
ncbi:unnamed protein product [Peronospora farinosa]|uniref:tRNA-binding domain-containing protein n=1 Tax=Peronospora farinosa TaxID=134698 RepID=A0AAV0UFF9_9STRA|nr:unnamed protein product [Peronospora farinosa]CAI5734185.1 unnamed protein product [Peronospora farinosa]